MDGNKAMRGAGPPGRAAPTLAAARLVTAAELRALARRDPAGLAVRTAATWGLILAAFGLYAAAPGWPTFAAAFALVATQQHALFLLIHEGVHGHVARSRRRNDRISDILFAAPLFYSTRAYRAGHLPHHHHLGDHRRDLERRSWVRLRGRDGARALLGILSGWTAARAALQYDAGALAAGGSPVRYVGLVALTQGALLGYCWLLGVPWAWVTLWVVPLFTATNALLTLRVIAEHQPEWYARGPEAPGAVDFVPPLTRTFVVGPFSRFVFAPVGLAWHHEHHLWPGVPFTRLPALHRLLCERGYYARTPGVLETSYLAVLRRLARPASPRSAAR